MPEKKQKITFLELLLPMLAKDRHLHKNVAGAVCRVKYKVNNVNTKYTIKPEPTMSDQDIEST